MERIYSESEIKLIKEIFDMYIKQIYDEDLEKLINECKEMFLEGQEKLKEIERLNNIIKNIENICESSIASVDNILQDEKETKIVNGRCINRNEYQIVRLKAYRTKSKEILEKIKELKGSDKE